MDQVYDELILFVRLEDRISDHSSDPEDHEPLYPAANPQKTFFLIRCFWNASLNLKIEHCKQLKFCTKEVFLKLFLLFWKTNACEAKCKLIFWKPAFDFVAGGSYAFNWINSFCYRLLLRLQLNQYVCYRRIPRLQLNQFILLQAASAPSIESIPFVTGGSYAFNWINSFCYRLLPRLPKGILMAIW